MNLIPLAVSVILVTLMFGCGESGADIARKYISDNAACLLRPQEGSNCEYIRYDRIVTHPPICFKTSIPLSVIT